MKKHFTKLLCMALSLIAVISTVFVVGCGSPAAPNTSTDLQITYWESGNGRLYMDKIIKRFEELNPEYNVIFESSSMVGTDTVTQSDSNTVDLYITAFENRNAYAEYLEPLNDFVNEKPDGEDGKTISEKLGDFVNRNLAEDGKLYALPWLPGSMTGLLYNVDMFKGEDGEAYKVPNTTDELISLCETIKADGKTPFVHYKDYWYYIFESWVAQYEGLDAFYDIWNGVYTDSEGVKHANDVRIVTESKGREEAYKVMAQLLSPQGYAYTNTNNFNHTTSQTYFLSGKAVMQPNGSWVENEMKNADYDTEFRMMKTPVLSAFGKKIGINSDAVLSIIVDYVDGKTLGSDDMAIVNEYDESVIEKVREARNVHFLGRSGDVFIPNYSIAKDAAKEFLKFYYSDEAMLITQQTLNSFVYPSYSNEPVIDKSGWSDFMKGVDDINKDAISVICNFNTSLFYNNSLTMYHYHPIENLTYRQDGKTLTASDYWTKEKTWFTNNWNTLLRNAGLID